MAFFYGIVARVRQRVRVLTPKNTGDLSAVWGAPFWGLIAKIRNPGFASAVGYLVG
jgi:hypothetical protein